MITVDIEQIVPTENDLQFALVVRYGEGGAVRFARARIEDDVLDWKTLQDLGRWITRQVERHLDREADLLEAEDVPLF